MSRAINFLVLKSKPIFNQLCLEERLLRCSKESWCILNDGVDQPAIVMGISAKTKEVLHESEVRRDGIQVLRRFTGGGTVVVDKDTLFCTLIMQKRMVPDVPAYPRTIMKWTEEVYKSVFSPFGNFSLQENGRTRKVPLTATLISGDVMDASQNVGLSDYAFDSLKFGGNAQSITKDTWIHHTSFLWDYEPRFMRLLKSPPRQPEYRKFRDHSSFLCCLKDYMDSRDSFVKAVRNSLQDIEFHVMDATENDALSSCKTDFKPTSKIVDV